MPKIQLHPQGSAASKMRLRTVADSGSVEKRLYPDKWRNTSAGSKGKGESLASFDKGNSSAGYL